ncbi:MAG: hypothetical protein LBG97_08735 [Coriobacteriales bacterium]|jgi:hypothetical protein|nr:hypothetical protein [Coriobacteriales bacterium]
MQVEKGSGIMQAGRCGQRPLRIYNDYPKAREHYANGTLWTASPTRVMQGVRDAVDSVPYGVGLSTVTFRLTTIDVNKCNCVFNGLVIKL